MGMITSFYRNGTVTKRENYENLVQEVKKLEVDEKMVREQIEALEKKPLFKHHPKRKQYLTNLEEELEKMLEQKQKIVERQNHALELSEWSKVIVEVKFFQFIFFQFIFIFFFNSFSVFQVCEWLELNLDDYCINQLKLNINKQTKPVPELNQEQIKSFSKGLAEITYNLAESQDFFQASIDGRLLKYHNIEKEIIEAQLEVMRKYPEDNPRRVYVENELLKDLEYVQGNTEVDPEGLKRREKMLANHQEFYKVLKFHKDKLKAFGVDTTKELVYDPRYDHYQE